MRAECSSTFHRNDCTVGAGWPWEPERLRQRVHVHVRPVTATLALSDQHAHAIHSRILSLAYSKASSVERFRARSARCSWEEAFRGQTSNLAERTSMESHSAHIAAHCSRDFSFFGSCGARGLVAFPNLPPGRRGERLTLRHFERPWASFRLGWVFSCLWSCLGSKTRAAGRLTGPVLVLCALRGFASTQDAAWRGGTLRARAGCRFVLSTLLPAIALFAASTVSTHAQTRTGPERSPLIGS